MKISEMAGKITPSLTRKLFDMAKAYPNTIDLTLGDPDYETPMYIKEAACDAIMQGKTKYSANAGLLELRIAISDRICRETGVHFDPETEIQITVGAMEAIYLTLCCLIDPGDEVIIPSPHWVNYRHMTQLVGGVPILVNADEEHDFVVTAEAIRSAVTDRTRVIIINSPNNPTGTVYDRATLEEISRIAMERDITILFDECYKSILYDGERFTSILDFPGMKEHAVVVNSCSKRYSMTGWRLGYAAGPAELISNMSKLQEKTSLPVRRCLRSMQPSLHLWEATKNRMPCGSGMKKERIFFLKRLERRASSVANRQKEPSMRLSILKRPGWTARHLPTHF